MHITTDMRIMRNTASVMNIIMGSMTMHMDTAMGSTAMTMLTTMRSMHMDIAMRIMTTATRCTVMNTNTVMGNMTTTDTATENITATKAIIMPMRYLTPGAGRR